MGEAAVPLRTLSLKRAHSLQRTPALLNCRNLNEEYFATEMKSNKDNSFL